MFAPRSKPHAHLLAAIAVVLVAGYGSLGHAASAFFSLDDDAPVARTTPRAAKRAARVSPRAVEPAAPANEAPVAAEPTLDSGERKSTATNCPTCDRTKRRNESALPVDRIAGAPKGYHSAQEACYSQAIFEGAQRNTRRLYRNRTGSGGYCARGVSSHLYASGVTDGSSLGDAIDFQARGRLEAIGFKNFISEYPTAAKAPKGAVLVFAGPASSEYITHGVKKYSGGCTTVRGRHGKRVRKCYGAGNWAGHVTIAGENRSSNARWWYTDARTPDPAVSKRRLIGVYLMQKCTGGCSQALRNRCGG